MALLRRASRTAAPCGRVAFATLATPLAAAVATTAARAQDPGALIDPVAAAWREALAASPTLTRLAGLALEPAGIATLSGVAVALVLGVIGALALRRRRHTAGLAIRLELPAAVEGEFEITLSRSRPARAPRRSRRSRRGVRRETQLDGLAPGLWRVRIDGPILAPRSRALLATVAEEIEVRLERGGVLALDVPLPEVTVPVELRVRWDRQAARAVGVSLRGRPDSIRYAGQGVTRLRLAPGRHTIVIGAADRVLERELEIVDYEPISLHVDLADAEGLVFKGCPPAVTPFLQGDLDRAGRALERDGQADLAHLLFAQLHQEQGQTERAAEQLETAGRWREAADLRRALGDHTAAAGLYERAGELSGAAEMYEAAGAWSEAARLRTATEDWAAAAHDAERAGDTETLIVALEAAGELIRAAALAAERDERGRAIRLLQKIVPGHPDHGRARELLALAFEQEGHLDLAARELENRLAELAPGETTPGLELHLADLWTETGEWSRALGLLEGLRDRDPTYPNVATRIESLRKKISVATATAGSGVSRRAGATAFVADDRYEILEEIGRGGMGLVHRALDRRLGREVALKRMPDNLREHPTAVSLFLREAQAAARMNHPNIVTLFDADQEDGRFFITMELLDGLPLNTLLARRGRFGPRDTARLALQVCAGLEYAHAQGIVHRDVKTANLFMTRAKVLKIMDFGLAKILEAVRDGGATVIAGTPFYMAPEQAAGEAVDARTDLYALGVTLYELSTGRVPFREGDVAAQHRSAPVPDPRASLAGYPDALARLILDLMAKSPDDRPASAASTARRLEAFLAEQQSRGTAVESVSNHPDRPDRPDRR